MEVEYEDSALETLANDASFSAGLSPGVEQAFRKRIQGIEAAVDERDFFAMRSWRFEKLKGNRLGQYSMRLNDQWRLILRFRDSEKGKVVSVVEIVDYH